MKKEWVVAFGTEKFYLTTEEMDFYRQQLLEGKRFIALKSGMVLSDKALYIASVGQLDEADRLEDGKWQCERCGTWHNPATAICACNYDFQITDGKAVKTLKA